MFVSSYSTFIHTNTTDKTAKTNASKEPYLDKSFNVKGLSSSQNLTNSLVNTPVNYLSNYKSLNTKAQIQQQAEQNNQTTKFAIMNSQIKASSAYTANSIMFSLMPKSQPALKHNTQNIDQNLPQEIKDIKESFLKIKMVDTYISNNNYYQITA